VLLEKRETRETKETKEIREIRETQQALALTRYQPYYFVLLRITSY
jgi:hypothetical protein